MATMTEVVGATLTTSRRISTAVGLFAAFAVLLVLVGIYGVISYVAKQRSHEIGIRLALGARGHDVSGLMLRQGLMPVAAGLVVGLAAAAGFAGLLRGLLHGVTPLDPVTYLFVGTGLFGVALIASWAPIRRATLVDPVVSLRSD